MTPHSILTLPLPSLPWLPSANSTTSLIGTTTHGAARHHLGHPRHRRCALYSSGTLAPARTCITKLERMVPLLDVVIVAAQRHGHFNYYHRARSDGCLDGTVTMLRACLPAKLDNGAHDGPVSLVTISGTCHSRSRHAWLSLSHSNREGTNGERRERT